MVKITVIQSLKGCLFRWLLRVKYDDLTNENRRIYEVLEMDPEIRKTHPEYFSPEGKLIR